MNDPYSASDGVPAELQAELARLRAELDSRNHAYADQVQNQGAIIDVLKMMSSSAGDTTPVFEIILKRAVQLSGAAGGTFFEYDGAFLHHRMSIGFDGMRAVMDARYPRQPTGTGEFAIDAAILNRRVEYLPVTNADRPVRLKFGVKSFLAVPLLRDGEAIGVMGLGHKQEAAFSDTLIELMQAFAEQAVIAMSSAATFRALQHRTEELARSLAEVQALEQISRTARAEAETALANLRLTQDRLVQSEKLASLGQLTAGIAHEIKNPLNFVNNFAELSADLLDELSEAIAPARLTGVDDVRADIADLTTTLQTNLRKIVQHGKRADSIVKNMLLHSRSGASELRRVAINDLADEALTLAYHGKRAEIPDFAISLVRDYDPQAGQIEAFPQELNRVLLNLISNGFYATHKRGLQTGPGFTPTLRRSTRSLGDSVEISVRDNGTGIDETTRARLFEPFFTTKPPGEGTGLGLSISYDIIVKQHGGQITVDSRPDDFTQFNVILPRTLSGAATQ